jgi:dUTP pyrophosphatase
MMNDDVRSRLRALEATVRDMTQAPIVLFKKLRPDAVVPQYKSAGAAGLDLVAMNDAPLVLESGAAAVIIPTGLAIELPPGYEGQIRPRSGLAIEGVGVANSPGTLDCDFRGEVCVILSNFGRRHVVRHGDRIAQLVIAKVAHASLVEVNELSDTLRGQNGFGSTGTR